MSLKRLKQEMSERKGSVATQKRTPKPFVGVATPNTRQKLSSEGKEIIARAETTAEVQAVLDSELPFGYHAIGKNELPKLMKLKQDIIDLRIVSFDYETNGDPEDETQDPQDHMLVGASFACRLGQAYYIPVAHDGYGANIPLDWFVANFLKPVLEHPEVLIIVHNCQFEHQISLLHGVDMFPKTERNLIVDTMLIIKSLALDKSINPGTGEVIIGLKPNTKAFLADDNGMVHGLLHIDSIKSFVETVTTLEQDGVYKSGANKGQPKYKKVVQTFNMLPVTKHTIDYGCSDSDWALGLYHKLMPLMVSEGLAETFFELNVPFSMVLGEYELTGWRVEPSKLQRMREIANRALEGYTDERGMFVEGLNAKLQRALIEVTADKASVSEAGEVIVPAGLYGMGNWKNMPVSLEIMTSKPFGWGSWKHKVWLFFHILKLDTRGLERSKKTGMPGTGGDNYELIVDSYQGDNTFMKVLKEKSKYDKIMSTYVNGMEPFIREDTQKIHTHLKLVSTWRLSSSKPNLQNIPRADNDPMGIRGVFEAPVYDLTKDYSKQNILTRPPEIMLRNNLSGKTVYISCDYSQIELKVLAWYANEQAMISTLANGGDLHSVVARDVFKLNCTVEEVKSLHKPMRYRAKKVNFG